MAIEEIIKQVQQTRDVIELLNISKTALNGVAEIDFKSNIQILLLEQLLGKFDRLVGAVKENVREKAQRSQKLLSESKMALQEAQEKCKTNETNLKMIEQLNTQKRQLEESLRTFELFGVKIEELSPTTLSAEAERLTMECKRIEERLDLLKEYDTEVRKAHKADIEADGVAKIMVDAYLSRCEALDRLDKSLKEKLDKLQSRLAENIATIEQFRRNIDAVEKDIGNTIGTVEEGRIAFETHKEENKELYRNLENFATSFPELIEQISRAETHVDEILSKYDRLLGQLRDVADRANSETRENVVNGIVLSTD